MTTKNYIKIFRREEDIDKFYEQCCKYTEDTSTTIPEIIISIPEISASKSEFFHMCGVDIIYKAVNEDEVNCICGVIAEKRKTPAGKKSTTQYKIQRPVHLLMDEYRDVFKDFLESALTKPLNVPQVVVVLGKSDEEYDSYVLEHGVERVIFVNTPKQAIDTVSKELKMLADKCMNATLDQIFTADDSKLEELL